MCISDIGMMELEGMTFWSHHGCLESEKKKGNLFIVDFKGEMDMSRATESDALEDTVNYAEIYEVIRTEMEKPSELLEHVAGRIVKAVAERFPEFVRFSVRVSKRRPPVGGAVQWSRITLQSGQPVNSIGPLPATPGPSPYSSYRWLLAAKAHRAICLPLERVEKCQFRSSGYPSTNKNKHEE